MTTEQNVKYLKDWLTSCANDKGEVRTFSWAYAKGMLVMMQLNMIIDHEQYKELAELVRQYDLNGRGEQ